MMDGYDCSFRIMLNTSLGEHVGVVGNCPQLGDWHYQNGFILSRRFGSGDNNEVWHGTIRLPSNEEIQYRYFTCIIVDGRFVEQKTLIVRRWEANVLPRTIVPGNSTQNAHIDLFGTYFGETRVSRGWLTKETIVQFKLFNDPIQIWKNSLRGKSFRVKVTPVGVNNPNMMEDNSIVEDSIDVQEVRNAVNSWPIVEVGVNNQDDSELKLQEQYGKPLLPGDFLTFQVQVVNPETITFLVDFYALDNQTDAPAHIGFGYILQNNLVQSAGMATIPITNSKHLAIGQFKVEYLIVRPIEDFECDMSVSYARYWKHSWRGLEVGHRGAGSSFKDALKSCASIRENTIASLAYAANHGADMIEFDVQLSKDMVPVIYHDFHVAIAMKKKTKSGNEPVHHDLLKLPLKDLTYAQLQMLKVYHLKEYDGPKFNDDDFDDHQPFPTLQSTLERLEPHVGFNVEIKWTMQLKDGTYELNHPFELNVYLDTIIKAVLQYGGSRKIVFSCFHPDICTMIRLKQNKYPVMFLTQGITSRYSDYHDPRTHNIPMAVQFAQQAGLLGINVHTEDILRDPTQVVLVQEKGLVLFCWGEDNNDSGTIRYLKNIGLNGIIYDKIDEFSSKEIKESIFLIEAREGQKELMKLAIPPMST